MKWRVDGMRRQAWRLCMVVMMFVGLSTTVEVTGQSVVKDLENVKKPAFGKLYFSKKDSSLNVWRGRWSKVVQETASMPSVPVAPQPPVGEPVLQEIPLGFWELPDRVLVAKLFDGKYHLLQTNAARSYYVPRGKNLLSDSRTKVNSDVLTGDLLPSLATGNSDMGGLFPPATFKDGLMTAKGFVKNGNGEWVFGSAQTPPVVDPVVVVPPVLPPVTEKIKIPVGLIMWDNWEFDFWNSTKDMDKLLINHISRNRYSATYWGDKFDLVPFYGEHIEPEKIMIRYNIRWDAARGRNAYDSVEKVVRVKFDKNQANTEREVKYYRDAGFDFLCFNYYSDESYLSETRRDFVAMNNKLGMKMTFKIQRSRTDKEIDYITNLMTQDYWFRIDGKPVLYLNAGDFDDLNKYRAALKAKNGTDIYVVYYNFNGYPGDWQDYLQKGNNAISAYNTSIGGYATQEQQIAKEVSDRESWMGQFRATHVKLIPILSLGIENLDQRTDLVPNGNAVGVVESANLEQINRKNVLVKEFVNKYPEKVPAILWYSANEILEGGKSMVPKKLRDGRIDTSILDAVGRHLE